MLVRLKQATDFEATEFNTTLAKKLKEDLAAVAKPNTPEKIEPFMKGRRYMSQNKKKSYKKSSWIS